MAATVIYLPDAGTSNKGVVSVDTKNGLSVRNGVVSVGRATDYSLGTVIVDSNGDLEVDAGWLTVNRATNGRYGTVKPDISTTQIVDGKLTVVAVASEQTAGLAKVDGTTITADEDGTLHGTVTYEVATTEEATAGVDDEKLMTPLKVRQAMDSARVRMDIVTDAFGNKRLAYIVRSI